MFIKSVPITFVPHDLIFFVFCFLFFGGGGFFWSSFPLQLACIVSLILCVCMCFCLYQLAPNFKLMEIKVVGSQRLITVNNPFKIKRKVKRPIKETKFKPCWSSQLLDTVCSSFLTTNIWEIPHGEEKLSEHVKSLSYRKDISTIIQSWSLGIIPQGTSRFKTTDKLISWKSYFN